MNIEQGMMNNEVLSAFRNSIFLVQYSIFLKNKHHA